MKVSMKIAAIALGLGLLAGCASSGNEALRDETKQTVSNKIIEGTTTAAEVQAQYGAATSTSFTGDGLEIWTYEFENTSADAISYVPIVGSFGGTASGTKKQLTILFNESQVVKRVKLTEAAVKHKTGLFNN
ncbi:hypothetical protein F3F96_00700 [Mariprofundus sp. NF]|uniref:hypothetical protein n=1 Tax=Mariprofundus sp. NF TaxID=2608716 RepID=UPI0015A1A9A1|nr:hypothetical protein [Mariprofundus sp. NF]NWF37658.1 hypothetical protein [Mariprofundus sp. NF]